MSRAGHVLDDELGVSWNVLSHVGNDEAGPQIIKISRRGAHDNSDRLPLIEGSLGLRIEAPQQ